MTYKPLPNQIITEVYDNYVVGYEYKTIYYLGCPIVQRKWFAVSGLSDIDF